MKRVLFAAAVVLGAGGCGAGEEASDRVSDPAERATTYRKILDTDLRFVPFVPI
jgi:hypothetical protein